MDIGLIVAHASCRASWARCCRSSPTSRSRPAPAPRSRRPTRRYAFDLDVLEDDARALGVPGAEDLDLRQTPGERRRQILALTAQDLRRAARLILDPSRLNLVLVRGRSRTLCAPSSAGSCASFAAVSPSDRASRWRSQRGLRRASAAPTVRGPGRFLTWVQTSP